MTALATLPWYLSIPLCLFLSALAVLLAVIVAFAIFTALVTLADWLGL